MPANLYPSHMLSNYKWNVGSFELEITTLAMAELGCK